MIFYYPHSQACFSAWCLAIKFNDRLLLHSTANTTLFVRAEERPPAHHANVRQLRAGDAWERAALYSGALALIHIQQQQLYSSLRTSRSLLSLSRSHSFCHLLSLSLRTLTVHVHSCTCTHIASYSFTLILHQGIPAAPLCQGSFSICYSSCHSQGKEEKECPSATISIWNWQEKSFANLPQKALPLSFFYQLVEVFRVYVNQWGICVLLNA